MDGPVLWLADKTGLHRIHLWAMRGVRDTHWLFSQFYLLVPGIPAILCAAGPDILRSYFGEVVIGSWEEYALITGILISLALMLFFLAVGFQVALLCAFGAYGMFPRQRWINYQNWLIAELEAMGEPKPQKPSDTP